VLERAKLVGVGQQKRGNMGDSTKRVVLLCDECGERTVPDDPEAVWRSGYTAFECRCGEKLTLADRREEKTTELPPPSRTLGSCPRTSERA
jgi:hypothetical protein